MEILSKLPPMIYNVYRKGGETMKLTVSKWGNSIGIRIPIAVKESLELQLETS